MSQFRTQSRRASLVESLANIAVGILIQGAGQAGLFYVMRLDISVKQFTAFTLVMTVLSVIRSYCLRRLWNAEWWKRKEPARIVEVVSVHGVQTQFMNTPWKVQDNWVCNCDYCKAGGSCRGQ